MTKLNRQRWVVQLSHIISTLQNHIVLWDLELSRHLETKQGGCSKRWVCEGRDKSERLWVLSDISHWIYQTWVLTDELAPISFFFFSVLYRHYFNHVYKSQERESCWLASGIISCQSCRRLSSSTDISTTLHDFFSLYEKSYLKKEKHTGDAAALDRTKVLSGHKAKRHTEGKSSVSPNYSFV